MKRIAVIGATGTIGSSVTSELLADGFDVVTISRTATGARSVQADLTIPSTLDGALRGADAAFLVWTAPADAAPAAIERIAHHVKQLVFLSAPHKTPHPFFQQPNPMAAMMARIENLIETSTLDWTFLRPGMFAANSIGWWAPQIRAGNVVRWPYGQAATAPIDDRDIAAVAARVLRTHGDAGRDYVLTGPQSLTQAEQVEIIGDVLGRRVTFEEITPAQARLELPFPPAALDMLVRAWSAAVGLPAFVTTTVREITRRPARTFREWTADHSDAFR